MRGFDDEWLQSPKGTCHLLAVNTATNTLTYQTLCGLDTKRWPMLGRHNDERQCRRCLDIADGLDND